MFNELVSKEVLSQITRQPTCTFQLFFFAWTTISMQPHSLTHIRQLHANSLYSFKNNPCVQIASFFSSLLSPCYNLTVHYFTKDSSFRSTYIKWFLLYYQYFFLSILGTMEGLRSYLEIQNLCQYWNSKHLVLAQVSERAGQTKGIVYFLLFSLL